MKACFHSNKPFGSTTGVSRAGLIKWSSPGFERRRQSAHGDRRIVRPASGDAPILRSKTLPARCSTCAPALHGSAHRRVFSGALSPFGRLIEGLAWDRPERTFDPKRLCCRYQWELAPGTMNLMVPYIKQRASFERAATASPVPTSSGSSEACRHERYMSAIDRRHPPGLRRSAGCLFVSRRRTPRLHSLSARCRRSWFSECRDHLSRSSQTTAPCPTSALEYCESQACRLRISSPSQPSLHAADPNGVRFSNRFIKTILAEWAYCSIVLTETIG